MKNIHAFLEELLEDRKIDDQEVDRIQEHIEQDGSLDLDDVALLVQIYCNADSYSPKFEKLFFHTLKEVILKDGKILASEQFYLLKMLYSDRVIRPAELQFLKELRANATESPPEFDRMLDDAAKSSPTNWSSGGE